MLDASVAGRKVQIAAAKSNLKHVTLELGGKSASIVFEDDDIANAVCHNSQMFLFNNAQTCSGASRVFVHERIAPTFIENVKEDFTWMSGALGDPTKPDTFLGPMVDKAQVARVDEYVQEAKSKGIEVLAGGEKRPGTGQYYTPTVLLNPDLESRVWTEEIFGPVLMVRTFKTEDEVIELANDTSYGLSGRLPWSLIHTSTTDLDLETIQGIIFTPNISRALRVASKIDVGTFSVNGVQTRSKFTPWGGWKGSGYGREGGLEAVKEYVQSKTVHIHLGV